MERSDCCSNLCILHHKSDTSTLSCGLIIPAFERIKHSWKSYQAVSILINIATRVSSHNIAIRDRSVVFLATARVITAEWTDVVMGRAQNSTDESQKADLVDQGVKISSMTQTMDRSKLRATGLQRRTHSKQS